jgi:hypothetical protein
MRYFCLILLALALQIPAAGAIITNTQGTENFTNGTQLDEVSYPAGNTDIAPPFDNVESGFDADGIDGGFNFDVTWTHNHGVILDPILTAFLRIGLWEHESFETGSQLGSLTLNTLFGASLTPMLNALMEGSGGTTVYDIDGFPVSSEYNIYSVSLPAAVFADLTGGSATFRLQLQGQGVNLFGQSEFNGAFIDFAELVITTQDEPTPVPEPSTLLLTGLLLPALFLLRRR